MIEATWVEVLVGLAKLATVIWGLVIVFGAPIVVVVLTCGWLDDRSTR